MSSLTRSQKQLNSINDDKFKMKKAILVMYPFAYLNTNPTTVRAFNALIKHFDLIDAYAQTSNYRIEAPIAALESLRKPTSRLSPYYHWPVGGQFMHPASSIALKLLGREYGG